MKEIPNLSADFCDFLLEPAEESAATEEELYSRIGRQAAKEQ